MTNLEKYKEEILKPNDNFCEEFVIANVLKPRGLNCSNLKCTQCELIQQIWANDEYKEPEVDWSKVVVDTPVYVSDDNATWKRMHFAFYRNEKVYCYQYGKTSFTSDTNNPYNYSSWEYAKLAKENEHETQN